MSRRLLASALIAGALLAPSLAQADDSGDVRSVISSQLRAFKAGDGVAAYSFAAPSIKAMFPSPDVFMSMVRNGYSVVVEANNVTFGPMRAEGEGFRQDVNMTDAEGHSYIASYTLARQPDGSLKITSCSIRKGDDFSA